MKHELKECGVGVGDTAPLLKVVVKVFGWWLRCPGRIAGIVHPIPANIARMLK